MAIRSVFTALVVSTMLLVSGCSTVPDAAAPTADIVIARHIEAGMSPSVADCVVGIGSQELTLAALLPDGARDQTEDALYMALIASCEEASAFVNREPVEPETLAFDDEPFTRGDDPLLDRLWDLCGEGDGEACDRLWETAAVGSDYERFGVTCGERDQLLDCTEELTEETVEEIDAAAEARARSEADNDDSEGSEDSTGAASSAPD